MKKYFYKTLGVFLAAATLSSCLKDDSMVLNPDKGHNVIEFANTTDILVHGSVIPLYVHSYEIVPEVTLPVSVSYSGPEAVAPEDITVNIAVADNSPIDLYNEEQETEYEMMPASNYTLSATSVVIPKGQSKATFSVKFKPNTFDLSKALVLPLKISSVSSGIISGNFNTILLNAGAKNKYDGNYTVTATAPMVDFANSTITGYYPLDSDLHTTGPNSVVMYCYTYLGGFQGHPIKAAGASSYYGSFAPVFTMDADGKVVSVTNYYGQPAGNGRSAQLNPAGVNKFTVNANGSKTLEVSYYMLQPGTSVRTTFSEKWTFVKNR
ncbi:DUF1735 domain-containing protein [Daejeonella oryzae]|uniref:DUF1735 domain-containing protein n=1 Tax=Daejeonella oryzae TaxID=1122943 RepID=UPI00047E386D|nr:DUF1735 domain-containing protein [Daejeonella oryzae]